MPDSWNKTLKDYVSIRRGPFLALVRDLGDGPSVELAEALRRQLRAKNAKKATK